MNARLAVRPVVGLTGLQSRAYAYIWRRLQVGPAPSYDEIAAHLGGASRGNVARLIACLVARGYLRKREYSARSLYLAPGAPMPVEPAGGSHVALTSPLAADLVARADAEGRAVSDLLEEAVALYLGRSL